MDYNILIEYGVDFMNIVSHRINNDNNYEFLFKIFSDRYLDLNFEDSGEKVYVQEKGIENGISYYNIWIQDNCSFESFYLAWSGPPQDFGFVPRNNIEHDIISKIYDYCSRENIKIFYCFVHKLKPPKDFFNLLGEKIQEICDKNYEEQLETVKQLKKFYPEHKLICNDLFAEAIEHYELGTMNMGLTITMMKRNDVLYIFNHENQIITEGRIVLFERIMQNIPTTLFDTINFSRQNQVVSIENVIERTRNYIEILNYNDYLRKASINTIILATNNRISANSSLKVLPTHLLRKISLWM